jgi:hypothetical protein
MSKKRRISRWSRRTSFLLASLSFPVLVVGIVTRFFFGPDLRDFIRGEGDLETRVLYWVAFAGAVAVAYGVSVGIYRTCRWKKVLVDERYCSNCDYDLTGNVSGVCPECGEATGIRNS